MATMWPTDIRALIDEAGPGWGGLWSLIYTTERAVGALGQVVSFAEGMDLLWLGSELSQVAQDLARGHPSDVAVAVAVDLGPLADGEDPDRARRVVATLIGAVIARADQLIDARPPTADVIALTCVASMAFSIRAALSGSLR